MFVEASASSAAALNWTRWSSSSSLRIAAGAARASSNSAVESPAAPGSPSCLGGHHGVVALRDPPRRLGPRCNWLSVRASRSPSTPSARNAQSPTAVPPELHDAAPLPARSRRLITTRPACRVRGSPSAARGRARGRTRVVIFLVHHEDLRHPKLTTGSASSSPFTRGFQTLRSRKVQLLLQPRLAPRRSSD